MKGQRGWLLVGLLLCSNLASASFDNKIDNESGNEPGVWLASAVMLSQDADSEVWQTGEIDELNQALRALPAFLLPAGNAATPLLRIFKNHQTLSPHATDGERITIAVTNTKTGPSKQASVTQSLQTSLLQQLLHQLLHRYAQQQSVGLDPAWLSLSGWRPRWGGWIYRADNQDPRAYAYETGMENPVEDFVTAAEYFFQPPDSTAEATLKCRIPRKYQYLKQQFPAYISALEHTVTCRAAADGLLNDLVFYHPLTGQKIELGSVTRDTVLGFELLYATPGTSDAAEIAGHLLLRIKLDNNPTATRAGIENPNDLVVSFLADTFAAVIEDDNPALPVEARPLIPKECETGWFGIENRTEGVFDALHAMWQALKGLSGGFLTMMDRQTLAQTIKHYTVDEDRNLLRYSLNLSDAQKRSLLEHLYQVKKNYKSRYYFFDQNCASVLVKIIGQGIGNRAVAEFDPWVSPPNSLVALLLRQGLVEPVYPTFYSFRKRGQIAQETLKIQYQQLQQQHQTVTWPNIDGLFEADEEKRVQVIEALAQVYRERPPLQAPLYAFANLIQQAELTYSYHDKLCENYSLQSSAAVRVFQREMLRQVGSSKDAGKAVSTLALFDYADSEKSGFNQGVSHTRLLPYGFGAGLYHNPEGDTVVSTFSAAFVSQDMGSMSSVAMQRGNAVGLGEFDIGFTADTTDPQLQYWRFTGLSVRKLKERLNRIPAYFSPAGSVGMGLSALQLHKDNALHLLHGNLAGAELLFNLSSSAENNDYAFVTLGLDLHRHITAANDGSERRDESGFMLPLYLETLNTWQAQRRLQWHNKLEYRLGLDHELANETEFASEFNFRLSHHSNDSNANHNGPMIVFKTELRYGRWAGDELSATSLLVGVEISRW